MKKTIIHLGDRIITTKKFPQGKDKKATLIYKTENSYGAKFDEPFKECHYLKINDDTIGILQEKKGFFLEANQFKVTSTYKNNNKKKEKFVHFLKDKYYDQKSLIPTQIKEYQDNIKYYGHEIENNRNYIKNLIKNIKKRIKNIEKTKQNAKIKININNLEKEYDKLMKHKGIKEIILATNPNNKEKYIVVTTNDLIYHDSQTDRDRHQANFNLGAYKIFIPLNINLDIKTINYKRQLLRGGYFHPCIKERGIMCLGNQVKNEINSYRKNSQFMLLIFLLVNFLQEPDYHDPYIDAQLFIFAQPVTIKPKNIFNYLNHEYWRNYEKWDNDKYNSQRE